MSLLNLQGAFENELVATGEFHPQAPRTALMLPSGQRVVVPTAVLLQALAAEGAVPVADDAREDASAVAATRPVSADADLVTEAPVASTGSTEDETVIPLVAEELHVEKRQVETGRVRLRRETKEEVQRLTVPLTTVTWEVEHVPVNTPVEAPPEVRQVGETLIFSLVEERMVVKRELWLREEVHVRKVTSVVEKSAEFPVKRDVLVEERTGSEAGSADVVAGDAVRG